MKKSRIFLKTALVVVLSLTLLMFSAGIPTFSWFARPQSQSGNANSYGISSGDNMRVYDGNNVTMKTYLSTDDGISFSQTEEDFSVEGNRKKTLGTSSPANRVYYKTVLTNSSGHDENVSLYLKNFRTGSTGNVCVGVNDPIKSFKNNSHYETIKPLPSKLSSPGTGKKRIYFMPGNNNRYYDGKETGWESGYYVVCSAQSGVDSNGDYAYFTQLGTDLFVSSVWYADIPANHNELFIAVENWKQSYQRTQTFTNLQGDGLSQQQSLFFNLNGTYTGYKNAYSTVGKVGGDDTGANISEYYSSAQLGAGESIDLGLDSSQYSGTISYSIPSEQQQYATVSENGVVTAANNLTKTQTVELTYTATSQYDDTVKLTCAVTINVYPSEDNLIANAPIVTNFLIPGSTENNENVKEVYWFIQNGDEMYGTATSDANISFENVYLGL